MKNNVILFPLDLRIFEVGGGAAGGDGASAPAGEQSGTIITSDAEEAKRAEFEKMIKGDYKDLFDERVKKNIDSRFKQTKALEAQVEKHKAFSPVLDAIASKYGVDAADAEAMMKALESDSSFFEEEASRRGLTVEQYREYRKLEQENARFREAQEAAQKKANADQMLSNWYRQAEATKQYYGGFNLENEVNHPETGERFVNLLEANIDVKTAYEVVHKDELLHGAMRYTAQQTQEKTINDIRARGMRPQENGGSGNAAAAIGQKSPAQMTRKEREEYAQRALRGERITFR